MHYILYSTIGARLITEQEAQSLINKLIELRSSPNKQELFAHERLCINKLKYIVMTKTAKYRKFNNYEDLVQDGFEALFMAVRNYNPSRGSFFWWAHKYIDTRISRHANLHTTIRYPLKYSKEISPHRENIFPILIEKNSDLTKFVEENETKVTIENGLRFLDKESVELITLAFGLSKDKPMSVSKICDLKKISRQSFNVKIKTAFATIASNIPQPPNAIENI